jgi:hypothetical protein
MRLFRLYFYPRKIVIYHATWDDLLHKAQCLVRMHEYLTVMEYPSVGAKEERCLHCLKPRYRIDRRFATVDKLVL